MRAKFGVPEQIQVYTYRPNFIRMRSLCRLPVAKNHNFGQILTFLGAPVPTPFYRWRPHLVCYSRPTVYVYLQNFVSIGLFCLPLPATNPNFCRFLDFGILVMSPFGINLRKLMPGAQLQTFPYPTVSKPFLYSNAFMAKSGAQTWRQTDRQTHRQTKSSTFWPPQRRVKSEPHQTWHSDRGPRARSCTSKPFGGLTQFRR